MKNVNVIAPVHDPYGWNFADAYLNVAKGAFVARCNWALLNSSKIYKRGLPRMICYQASPDSRAHTVWTILSKTNPLQESTRMQSQCLPVLKVIWTSGLLG